MSSLIRFAVVSSVVLMVTALVVPEAYGQRHQGTGIGVGSTTMASGLSVKQHAGGSAFQLTAGCWRGCDGVAASLDVLASMPAVASGSELSLAWNFGGGGAVGVGDDEIGVGASLVLGLELSASSIPVELVVEWRPGLSIIPEPSPNIEDVGAHIRLYP